MFKKLSVLANRNVKRLLAFVSRHLLAGILYGIGTVAGAVAAKTVIPLLTG